MAQPVELRRVERLRGDVEKIPLGALSLLPVHLGAWAVAKAFQFAQRLGQHGGVELAAHHPVAPVIALQQRRCDAAEAEPAAAFPVGLLGHAACVCAIDDFAQPWHAVRDGVVAEFNADPATSHFVRDGSGCAGAEEGVEDEIAGVGGDLEDALHQRLRLRCSEHIVWGEPDRLFLCVLRVTDFLVRPVCLRYSSLNYFGEESFQRWNAISPLSPPDSSVKIKLFELCLRNRPKSPIRWCWDFATGRRGYSIKSKAVGVTCGEIAWTPSTARVIVGILVDSVLFGAA